MEKEKSTLILLFLFFLKSLGFWITSNYWLIIGIYSQGQVSRLEVSDINYLSLDYKPIED